MYGHKSSKNQGFTLTELLITLAVLGVLTSIAAPSFSDAMLNSHQVVKTNELMGVIRVARSEAIKQATRTSVCARADNDTCGSDWSNGFIAFTDAGDTPGVIDTDEEILRIAQGTEGESKIVNKARLVNTAAAPLQRNYIRFGPRGTSNWRGSGYFLVCDSREEAAARGINISLSGDPRRARRQNDILINSFGVAADCAAVTSGAGSGSPIE